MVTTMRDGRRDTTTMATMMVTDNDGNDNDVEGDCARSNEVNDDGDGATGDDDG